MRKSLLLAASLSSGAWVVPVRADVQHDCTGDHSDRRLEACTALIPSPRRAPQTRATLYRNRGVAQTV
jgi:hypothetical protein